jgi:hypothetical protein
MTRPHVTIPALGVALLLAATAPVGAAETDPAAASLPSVASGARPGPDVLYAPAPELPQLQHHHPRFRAAPLLVSGHEAYVDGEYLYQDHLFDDYGADSDGSTSSSLAANAGDLTYPTDRDRYGGNAADLVELRIAPGPRDVRYRITLNTLLEPDATIVALAFDTDRDVSTGVATLPRDPGAPFPGTDELVVTWGTGAEHHDLAGAAAEATGLDVTVDVDANQLTVTVPRGVSDPTGTWRATVAVGLHDGSGGWLRPGTSATEEQPGGAGPLAPAPSGIFNLGFRFDEPYVGDNVPPDQLQAEALRAGTPTAFAHDVDFDALAAGEDRSTVPDHGTTVRILPSRLELGEGRDLDAFPAYLSPLQPYSLYVPSGYDPAEPAPFTLNLHSLGQEHWQYNGTTGIQLIGEERGSLVATPMGRGPDGWYQHEAEVDTFEVWNDVARRFRLDPDRTAITGYSMGGYGTYRLGGLYPDLFGTAATIVGPPGDGIWIPGRAPTGGAETLSNLWLENVRNLPFVNLAVTEDELVPFPGPRAQNLGAPELGIDGFEQLGYRYRFEVFPTAEHFTIAVLDYDTPQLAEFLGEAAVDRDPSHVTFSYLPATDVPELGLVHDHAYWVSGVRLADDGDALAEGTVDAFSLGAGEGQPTTVPVRGAGVGPLEYVETGIEWEPLPDVDPENLLELGLTNVVAVELDLARASLDGRRELTLEVTADHEGEVVLAGAFRPGTEVTRDGEPLDGAAVTRASATVPVVAGDQTIVLRPAAGPRSPGRSPATAGGPLPATGGGAAAMALVALGLGRTVRGWRRRA